MELNKLRKYLYNHIDEETKVKDLVIRIREQKDDNKKIVEQEDIVYYNGIKILIIKDNKLKLSPNVFMLNATYIDEYQEKLNNEKERKEILTALAESRISLFREGYLECNKLMKIKYNKSTAISYKERKEDVENNKIAILNLIEENLPSNLKQHITLNAEYKNRRGSMTPCCLISNKLAISKQEKNDLSKMIDLLNIEYAVINSFVNFSKYKTPKWTNPIKRILDKTGWEIPEIEIFKPTSHYIEKLTEKSVEKIIKVTKQAVDKYLEIIFESEKYYQHQFMLNECVEKQFKQIGINNLYRFEEEYYTIESASKGRIDTVFVSTSGTDIYLIELKVNRNVIGGTNGIHKHLIDIENLCKISKSSNNNKLKEFLKSLKQIVNTRRKILGEPPIEFTENPKIHFYIIIGYTELSEKKYIKEEMLDLYQTEKGIIGIKNAIEKNDNYKNKVFTLNKNIHKVEENNCDVRIYFDKISYNKEKNKITLIGSQFEPYYFDNVIDLTDKLYNNNLLIHHEFAYDSESPLKRVSVYETKTYYHFITYGLSELGYQIEYTLKLKKIYKIDKEEITNICNKLKEISKSTYYIGITYYNYDYITFTHPIDINKESTIYGFITIPDNDFNNLNRNERLSFVKFIGITKEEIKMLKNNQITVKELSKEINTDITDYNRNRLV